MDRLAYVWFRSQAELALHKHKATAFQDHFNDVMEAVHGPDFIRVRPAGNTGDRKCDGYLQSDDTVFQVYAPTVVKLSSWVNKVDEDFTGAKAQWSMMRSWTFVHNQHDGLPADVAQALLKLKTDHPDLVIEQWPPTHLLEMTADLSEDRLVRVFGHPPREQEMRILDRGDIAEAVAGLALESISWTPDAADLPVVDPRKLDYNQLSEYPRRLITAGIAQAGMVEGYFDNNPDPTLRDRAGMLMKVEWLNLQRHGNAGDEAFHALYARVAANAEGSREATASLALLAYLFESCDIFGNPPVGWTGTAA
ncbi:ABC-three component system protein [Amycolatopsis sp. NPDC051373]|uniref:ABC-three component system protein n=1 Tax=Amycolatopsis sp. NPDC051373 TaxID=3155801 RepID=UPI00344F8BC6